MGLPFNIKGLLEIFIKEISSPQINDFATLPISLSEKRKANRS
jgi:hypothetical protein